MFNSSVLQKNAKLHCLANASHIKPVFETVLRTNESLLITWLYVNDSPQSIFFYMHITLSATQAQTRKADLPTVINITPHKHIFFTKHTAKNWLPAASTDLAASTDSALAADWPWDLEFDFAAETASLDPSSWHCDHRRHCSFEQPCSVAAAPFGAATTYADAARARGHWASADADLEWVAASEQPTAAMWVTALDRAPSADLVARHAAVTWVCHRPFAAWPAASFAVHTAVAATFVASFGDSDCTVAAGQSSCADAGRRRDSRAVAGVAGIAAGAWWPFAGSVAGAWSAAPSAVAGSTAPIVGAVAVVAAVA